MSNKFLDLEGLEKVVNKGMMLENVLVTKNFGNISGSPSSPYEIDRMSIKDFLIAALCSAEDTNLANIITNPSASLSLFCTPTSGEVGSSVTVKATLSCNGGSFKYGNTTSRTDTTTGVTFSNAKINGSTVTLSGNSATLTLDSSKKFTTSSQSVSAKSGSVSYTASTKIPVSNAGNVLKNSSGVAFSSTNPAIAAGSKTPSSSSLTINAGYYKMFCGCDNGSATLNSSTIRAADKVCMQNSTSEQSFSIPSGTKRVWFAFPGTSGTVTFKTFVSGQWVTENQANLSYSSVTVNDAGGTGVTYRLCTFTHATSFGSATDAKIKHS